MLSSPPLTWLQAKFLSIIVPILGMAAVADSVGFESQSDSQRYNDHAFEATQQATQPATQPATQGTIFASSQVEPRRKYCKRSNPTLSDPVGAILIPMNHQHHILKLPWSMPALQIGRGPAHLSGNNVVLQERRISNRHCRLTLGWQGSSSSSSVAQLPTLQSWRDGEAEPQVWVEDMGSSNGTFVSTSLRHT
jgi:serine/threonine/tyrosine protein kinase RAD53